MPSPYAGGVGLSPKLLGAGEHVVIHTRTHGKALIWPVTALLLVGALVGAGEAVLPLNWRPAGSVVVAGLGAVAAIWLALRPFLRWLTTTYTVTTRRLITRSGILHRHGKDLPLMRVSDVAYDSSLVDRMFGCGTLIVQTASDSGPITLVDVPDVQEVHLAVSELIFGTQGQPGDEPNALPAATAAVSRPRSRTRGSGRFGRTAGGGAAGR